MAGKVVINLTAGAEDPEAATIAFLVGTAAQAAGNEVIFFCTKEAVRLAQSSEAAAVEAEGRPALADLSRQFADAGGELLLCPVCVKTRDLDGVEFDANARVAGAAVLWEWIGDGATVFTY